MRAKEIIFFAKIGCIINKCKTIIGIASTLSFVLPEVGHELLHNVKKLAGTDHALDCTDVGPNLAVDPIS